VKNAADRLTAPGVGKEIGPNLGIASSMLQGLFIAPDVVGGCLKGAVLAAAVFEKLGYEVLPGAYDKRSDIVQSVKFGNPDTLKRFCEAIQKAAPVDSYVLPIPAPMPGYAHDVIMAAGAFVQGSSIELGADAPLREPYTAHLQGGLSWYHAKIGVILGADAVGKKN
jgi:cystathionine beta-lyase family protein involved in aluminum resistance